MSYLVALILLGINMSEKGAEELAFFILIKLLEEKDNENGNYRLGSLYEPSLEGLFSLSQHITHWIEVREPKLNRHLSES